jgi:hypothetical protein
MSSLFRRFFAVLFLVISSCGAVRAADPVTMTVESPFARTAKPLSIQARFARWFPLGITLTNKGEPVTGRLSLRLTSISETDGTTPTTAAYTEVDLPTNSVKRVWLYGRLDSEQWDTIKILLEGRGLKTIEQSVDVEATDAPTRVILTVGDAGERFNFLNGFRSRRLAVQSELSREENQYRYLPQRGGQTVTSQTFVRPLGSRGALVPDRWVGLELADAVVLHDFAHTALSPSQIAALRGYVSGGGTLVVMGGSNWQRLSSSPLADLWPVVPVSSGAATAAETTEIVERFLAGQNLSGADRLGGAPVVLTRGSLRPDSRLLAGTRSAPLMATRTEGTGRIVWLAMDPSTPPFIGWRGQEPLWIELTSLMSRPARLEGVDSRRMLPFNSYPGYYRGGYNGYEDGQYQGVMGEYLHVISNLQEMQMPPTSTIAWFLALYVFLLVPVNYFVLRAIDRREWAWVTVPVIAILFSIGSYAAARSIKGTDLLRRHLTIVQGSANSKLARTDTLLWVRSPKKSYYTVGSPNPTVALSDYQPVGKDARSHETLLRQDDPTKSFRAENVSVPMWSEAQFVGQGMEDTGQGVSIQPAATGSSFTLRNATPWKFSGALVASGGRLWNCGDGTVAPGATVPLTRADESDQLGPDIVGRIERAAKLSTVFGDTRNTRIRDTTLRDLAHNALATALGPGAARVNDAPFLIAWGTDAISPISIDGEEPSEQNVTLWAFRLPPLPQRLAASNNRVFTAKSTGETRLDPDRGQASEVSMTYQTSVEAAAPTSPLQLTISGTTSRQIDMMPFQTNRRSITRRQGMPQYYGNYSIKRNKTSMAKPLEVDAYDFEGGKWVPVRGTMTKSGGTRWKYTATLRPSANVHYIRDPDGQVELRAKTAHGWIYIRDVKVTPAGPSPQ